MLFLIIILNAIKFSSVPVNALGILSDIEVVEQLVVDFSHALSKPEWLKNVMNRSMCRLSKKRKLYLCQMYLKEDTIMSDFDFSWSYQSLDSVACSQQQISLRVLNEKSLKTNLISMYKCPSTYQGELLGELPLIYISESRFKQSAHVFIRKNRNSPLYPHRFIDGFTTKQLKRDGEKFLNFSHQKLPFQGLPAMYKKANSRVLKANTRKVATWRELPPYTKFGEFYPIISVCSLSKTQKLNFCKLFKLKNYAANTDFEVDENQNFQCERQTVTNETELRKGLEEEVVPVVKCPVMASPLKDEYYHKMRKIYSAYHFYMSVCPQADCVFLYEIKTQYGETQLKIESAQTLIDTRVLSETTSVMRMRYAARKMKKQSKTYSTSLSFKFTNYDRVYQVDPSLSRTEGEVVQLFEIINLTSPYTKFRTTMQKLNVCGLKTEKKVEYCKLTFGNQPHGYEINHTKETNMQCQRLDVVLNQFEVRQNIAMIRCPITNLKPFLGHFLSGGVSEKTAIMYSQSEMFKTIYAVALAPGIPVR